MKPEMFQQMKPEVFQVGDMIRSRVTLNLYSLSSVKPERVIEVYFKNSYFLFLEDNNPYYKVLSVQDQKLGWVYCVYDFSICDFFELKNE